MNKPTIDKRRIIKDDRKPREITSKIGKFAAAAGLTSIGLFFVFEAATGASSAYSQASLITATTLLGTAFGASVSKRNAQIKPIKSTVLGATAGLAVGLGSAYYIQSAVEELIPSNSLVNPIESKLG